MGLCKCRTITDLYCFVHKKAVCEHCVFPEHKVCVVGTYVEWLQDPDYEPPTCAVCKEELTEDNVLRLLCLDMFHPECIDVHAASFPPNTAQAGFTCPSCLKGIIPSSSADLSSPLAQQLLRHLNNAPWYKGNNLSSLPLHDAGESAVAEHDSLHAPESSNRQAAIPLPPVRQDTALEVTTSMPVANTGVASRKAQRSNYGFLRGAGSQVEDDDDDDKYRKHSIMQLFRGISPKQELLPLSSKRSRAFKCTTQKVLIVVALLSTLATVLFLSMKLRVEPLNE
ncbi:Zinc finger protein-like 1 [Balamuthia mandrillaris]